MGLNTKLGEKGEIDRYITRLVEKGFLQQPRIDFGEKFAPMAILDTMRVVLAIETQNKWKVYQMDVKLEFLKNIFMCSNHKCMKSKKMKRRFTSSRNLYMGSIKL